MVAASKLIKKQAGGRAFILYNLHLEAVIVTFAENNLFENKTFYIKAVYKNPELFKNEIIILFFKNNGAISYNSNRFNYTFSDKITLLISRRIKIAIKKVIYSK